MSTMNACLTLASLVTKYTKDSYIIMNHRYIYYTLLKNGKEVWLPLNDLNSIYDYLLNIYLKYQITSYENLNNANIIHLTDEQLKSVKSLVDKECDRREQKQIEKRQQEVEELSKSSLYSKCPLREIRLPKKYSTLSFEALQQHVSSVLGQQVCLHTTSIIDKEILLIRYSLVGDNRNDDYSD